LVITVVKVSFETFCLVRIEMQLNKVDRQAVPQLRQLGTGSSHGASDLMPGNLAGDLWWLSGFGTGFPASFYGLQISAVNKVNSKLMNLIFIDSCMKIDQIFSTGSCCFILWIKLNGQGI
jgi:hypothetical protein